MNISFQKLWENYQKEQKPINFEDLLPKGDLHPSFWQDFELDMDISSQLIEIARDFYNKLGLEDILEAKIEDITFTGSLANFNWSRQSDIDLHILVNYDKVDDNIDLVSEYFRAKSSGWNRKHKIFIRGHEVEIYVQDTNEPHHSTGVFSLLKNDWITKPSRQNIKVDFEVIEEKADSFIDQVERLEDLYEDKKYASAYDYAVKLMDKIKKFRSAGLEGSGEYSNENLVFKLLRKTGYLGILSDLRGMSYDKMMSINGNFVKKLKIYIDQEEDLEEYGLRKLLEIEPFQRKVKNRHNRMKKRLIGHGKQKNSPPFTKKPSYKRGKSAPPGFGGA